jgi:hypothetical protein
MSLILGNSSPMCPAPGTTLLSVTRSAEYFFASQNMVWFTYATQRPGVRKSISRGHF